VEVNETLHAAVFLKRRATRVGPFRFGHVGWAFQLTLSCDGGRAGVTADRTGWSAGAVENIAGNLIAAPGYADFWCDVVEDPLSSMLMRGYDEYKIVAVQDPHPEAALRMQARVGVRPYVIVFGNCVNSTHDVLRTFGATVPSPWRHCVPTAWFDRIPGVSISLAPAKHANGLVDDRRITDRLARVAGVHDDFDPPQLLRVASPR